MIIDPSNIRALKKRLALIRIHSPRVHIISVFALKKLIFYRFHLKKKAFETLYQRALTNHRYIPLPLTKDPFLLSTAINLADSLLIKRSTCLVSALAYLDLATALNIDAKLNIGVRKMSDSPFELDHDLSKKANEAKQIDAHAWIEVDGIIVHNNNGQSYQVFHEFKPEIMNLLK